MLSSLPHLVSKVTAAFIDAIIMHIAEGDRVVMKGLGAFDLRSRKAGPNLPGVKHRSPLMYQVCFQKSHALRDMIRKKHSKKEAPRGTKR